MLLEKSLLPTSTNNKLSLYDSMRQSGAVSILVENLQSELKLREGEIAQLQVSTIAISSSVTGKYNY